KGIRLLIAGSFNETYKRNAINNGFLIIECPDLVNALKVRFGTDKLTIRTDSVITVDFASSSLSFDRKNYSIDPVGLAAQELILVGGLEKWVAARLH
ncbi:MAG: homoaconitase, partial [Ignavibacteria bacterium]|nr:homoaconitase [Ignavibacteria bacterium]